MKENIELYTFFFQDVDKVAESDCKFYFPWTKFYPKFLYNHVENI